MSVGEAQKTIFLPVLSSKDGTASRSEFSAASTIIVCTGGAPSRKARGEDTGRGGGKARAGKADSRGLNEKAMEGRGRWVKGTEGELTH